MGFLTGMPGACLAVSGPGQIHGIAGLANAWSNCWPMVLLGGASFAEQESMGAFQEAPQIAAAKPFCKYAARPDSIERVPYFLEVAVRMCTHGRPGAAYIDLPANICMGQSTTEAVTFVPKCPPPPKTLADPAEVANAIELLKTAEHPLVIVGKGAVRIYPPPSSRRPRVLVQMCAACAILIFRWLVRSQAYGRAEDEMNEFMNKTQLPFLASPMGKGVVPDDSPLSVAAGRNAALSGCDVVFLVGARMNWIMHFGQPPRWAPDVKVIQLDIAAEEFGTSISTNGIDSNACRLCGDAKSVLGQLNDAVGDWSYPSGTEWWNTLLASVAKNVAFTEEAEKSDAVPMGYFRVFKELRDLLPRDAIIIAEGANTMDISRTSIPNFLPRKRLDAATFGTMGIGIGQLFAAGVVHPDQRIVAIEGDAAFGFSGMEMEAVIRYGLPVTCIVVNNNGIGGGSSRDPLEGGEENAAFEGGGADPTKWTPGNMGKETRYDLLVRPALTFGRTFSGEKISAALSTWCARG